MGLWWLALPSRGVLEGGVFFWLMRACTVVVCGRSRLVALLVRGPRFPGDVYFLCLRRFALAGWCFGVVCRTVCLVVCVQEFLFLVNEEGSSVPVVRLFLGLCIPSYLGSLVPSRRPRQSVFLDFLPGEGRGRRAHIFFTLSLDLSHHAAP